MIAAPAPERLHLTVRRAALISDLHLSPEDPAAVDRFIAFARTLPGRADHLLILGDLFEAYVGRKHLGHDAYRPIVRALDMLGANGVRVACLWGNRDFLLDDAFTRATGAVVAGDELSFDCGGARVLAVHGDVFCIHDVRYQAMKRKLRKPWIRTLSRTLPFFVLQRIAGGLRNKSKAAIAAKPPSEMGIVDGEVEARLREGFDVVVCGHVHEPRVRPLGGGTLVVLPAWPAPPGTLWFQDGAYRFDSQL